MNTTPDSVQVDQLPVAFHTPLHQLPYPANDDLNATTASSACNILAPAPENYENEAREPLKELSKNSKKNLENPDQEQEQEQNENDIGADKLNEYVAKVLEKLVKQRNKVAKLSSVLEKKGLISEKNLPQLQNMVQEIEDMACEGDDKDESTDDTADSKENLSPLKSRQIALLQEGKTFSPSTHSTRSARQYNLEDVLQISRKDIAYGLRFPGQVVEEHLEIINKSSHDFVVQIHVSCFNPELQDTEEYVYSVRRSHLYDYNDKHYLIMAPYSCAAFKFALKVPNIKFTGRISGEVKISIQGLPGSYTLNLTTDVSIPKIFCPKELSCSGLDYKVIKLAIKEGKKQDIKLPIRNNSDAPVTLELEFYDPQGTREAQSRQLFDCMVHPNVISIAPNGTTLTTVVVKPWKILSGVKGLEKPKPTRKIMVGRVRDTALVYSFVFWIELY